jgi:hypothetical protein
MQAIKDYDTNKWKVIGQKVGKPAKVSNVFSLLFRSRFRSILGFMQHIGVFVLQDCKATGPSLLCAPRSRRRSAHAVGTDFSPTHAYAYTPARPGNPRRL